MPDVLNETCHCISLDEEALVRHFDAALLRERLETVGSGEEGRIAS